MERRDYFFNALKYTGVCSLRKPLQQKSLSNVIVANQKAHTKCVKNSEFKLFFEFEFVIFIKSLITMYRPIAFLQLMAELQ